jgi:hypothetical protein
MHACPPLLFLDVDGVLNPCGRECPDGFTEHDLFPGEEPVRVSAAHGPLIAELKAVFRVVWATAWNQEANARLAPLLGIGPLPVLPMPPAPFPADAKLPLTASSAHGRAAVWIDDAHPRAAWTWARERITPALLIAVDPAAGLARAHVRQAVGWAERITGPRPR